MNFFKPSCLLMYLLTDWEPTFHDQKFKRRIVVNLFSPSRGVTASLLSRATSQALASLRCISRPQSNERKVERIDRPTVRASGFRVRNRNVGSFQRGTACFCLGCHRAETRCRSVPCVRMVAKKTLDSLALCLHIHPLRHFRDFLSTLSSRAGRTVPDKWPVASPK